MDKEKEEFKANLAKYSAFIKIFDGDITKWKEFLEEKGSREQVADDYQFVLRLEKKLKEDPGLLDRIKELLKPYERRIKYFEIKEIK
ncbi:hypothetical protein ES705_40574 [subsurface metagenome]